MYPIAWVVVESENGESWRWFLELLQQYLDLGNGEVLTILSDQHPAIISSVRSVLPNAEHILCVLHVYCIWARTFKGDDLKIQFWNCVRATCVREWRKKWVI